MSDRATTPRVQTGEGGTPDALVVGGGPSGSTVGGLLALRGWDVEILDRARFPRPKPCGECVNPGAVAILERLGLLDRIAALRPASLRGWRIRDPGEPEAVGTFGDGVPDAVGVPRAAFDHALLRAARERGAVVRQGWKVLDVRRGSPRERPIVRVRTGEGRIVERSTRVVVGADGLRSVTARCIGAHRRRPRIRKVSLTVRLRGTGPGRDRGRLFVSGERVVGLAPVHADAPLWNATVVVRTPRHGREVAADATGFVRSALARCPLGWRSPPAIVGGPWASGPFDWPVRRRVAEGVVLVGDAAGYFDPLTGQGIRRALRSAELASEVIDRALRKERVSERCLRTYDRAAHIEFRASRWTQRAIEAVVGRDGLRRPAFRRLAASPAVVDALVRVTGDAAPPHTLLRPSVWTKLLH